jgi:hypothetical protein
VLGCFRKLKKAVYKNLFSPPNLPPRWWPNWGHLKGLISYCPEISGNFFGSTAKKNHFW